MEPYLRDMWLYGEAKVTAIQLLRHPNRSDSEPRRRKWRATVTIGEFGDPDPYSPFPTYGTTFKYVYGYTDAHAYWKAKRYIRKSKRKAAKEARAK